MDFFSDAGEVIGVGVNRVQTFFSRLASEYGNSFVRTINYLVSESATGSVSGVVIQEWRAENEEFEIINESFSCFVKESIR